MRVKYIEPERRLYTEHLQIEKKSLLNYSLPKELPPLTATQHQGFQTNFLITLKNQYAFVLLHLKKTAQTKNTLSLATPDVCIFYNNLPYEILYNQNGQIRGNRGKQTIKLKEIYSFFKSRWFKKNLNKEEPCVACFERQQYLMLSDTDLFITCRKFKSDPFFAKLSYIRSKVNATDNPIKVQYDQVNDAEFTGLATQSLMNFQNQAQVLNRLGQHKYLRYCNTKICLFLNYEHNIKVIRAIFYYLKNSKNEYVFVNVSHLEFTNLTNAIRQREKRLKLKEEMRNQCLIMSSEKEKRYKRHETSPKVMIIEKEMNQAFQGIAGSLTVKANQQRIKQHQRNENVFHILYPSLKGKFDIVLTQSNFKRLKKDIFKFQERKPIFKSTNYHLKFKSDRSITEPISQFKSSFASYKGQ